MINTPEKKQHIPFLHGTVIALSGQKTVKVQINVKIRHHLYHKIITHQRNYLAHDENSECQIGDYVKIIKCPRVSKKKVWRLVSVEQAASTDVTAAASADASI